MARRLTLITLLFMLLGTITYGLDTTYTAKLNSRVICPNDTVQINLRVTGFKVINSYQFVLNFDPAILTYMSVSNITSTPAPTIQAVGNSLTIVWSNVTPYTLGGTNGTGSGILMTIAFKYHGLSGPIAFSTQQCEVARFVGGNMQILSGSFLDGGVTPKQDAPQTKLSTLLDVPQGVVVDTLSYHGFPGNVGAVTERVAYDPTKLTFISVTGSGNLATGFNVSVSGGIITIAWTNTAGKNINYPVSYFKLNFSYSATTQTPVSFSTGCVIQTSAPVSNLCATYINGLIVPPPVITSHASIGSVSNAIQGQVVEVPILLDSMPVNTSNFNINLTFDSPKLAFLNIGSPIVPVIVSQSGNQLFITNSNPLAAGSLPNGQLLLLRFVYQGVGVAGVNFATGCQFNNGSPVGVGYTNGFVTPATIQGHNSTIPYVTKSGNGAVDVPITLSDMPTNLGSVTMIIGFDATKLTLTGYLNPYGALVKPNNNIIKIAWSSTSPTNLNNTPFITLQFNYVAGAGSECSAPVYYTDMGSEYCLITDIAGATIPSNWNNGGVNVKFKVSGTLRYNNPPANSPLPGFTVKLKQGTSDVAVATTTSSGYFEMWANNGSYTLEAVPSTSAVYFSDESDGQEVLMYAADLPNVINNALRRYAGNVNQDSYLDEYDGLLILLRAADLPHTDWTLPNWVFGGLTTLVPNVTVGCSDVVNVELYGLCSGNVTGSNPYVY